MSDNPKLFECETHITPGANGASKVLVSSEITLRDLFAVSLVSGWGSRTSPEEAERFAREVYAQADALLAERAKGKP